MNAGLETYDVQGRLVHGDKYYVGTLLYNEIYPVTGGFVGITGGFLKPTYGGVCFVAATTPFYVNSTVCPDGNLWQEDDGIRIYGLTNKSIYPRNIKTWTFGIPPIGGKRYGLDVFNSKGELTFNSENPYMEIVGVYQMKVGDPQGGNITSINTGFIGGNYAVCLTSSNVYTVMRYETATGLFVDHDYQMCIYLDSSGILHAMPKQIYEVENPFGVNPQHNGSSGTVLIADISRYPL